MGARPRAAQDSGQGSSGATRARMDGAVGMIRTRAASQLLTIVRALTLSALTLALTDCLNAAYVVQAAGGQCDLACKARPISDVVSDPETPAALRELLASVADVKRYAVAHGLRPTDNYTRYVALDRPYVAWVVSASEPLRF